MATTLALNQVLEHLMGTLGISRAELALAVGASNQTVERWLADETYPQRGSRKKLDELIGLARRLDESFKTPEGAATWLRAPSGYFGGLTPLDALVRGRIDAVEAALEALDAGVFV
jgi:hypothetical protein